jgi:hypothetical protein
MELLKYYTKNQDNEAVINVVTDDDVREYMADENRKDDFAKFIHARLFYRYINPFLYSTDKKIKKENETKEYDEYALLFKNGFSLMANSCLLVETLEAFYRGWGNTNGPNEIAFLKFFGRDEHFVDFATNDMASNFYKHIRCGILHQGETTGGWTLTRESSFLLDRNNKVINAKKFMDKMKLSLETYENKLKAANFQNDDIWINAKKKIKVILKNT